MKKLLPVSLLFLMAVTALLFSACRKHGDIQEKPVTSISEKKFFEKYRSFDRTENALVEFIKRVNNKTPFIENAIKKIGYPHWDKLLTATNTAGISYVQTAGTKQVRSAGNTIYQRYYIPFARENQNHVNATMVITTTASDTSIGYLCDWQYRYKQPGSPTTDTSAERFALFFMTMSNRTFGHSEFIISDAQLFPSLLADSSGRRTVNLLSKNKVAAEQKVSDLVMSTCYNYYTCGTPGFCGIYTSGCDYGNCDREKCILVATLCWDVWMPSAGNSGTSWGSTGPGWGDPGNGGGGGTGGGNNSGNPDPPVPCDGPPSEASVPSRSSSGSIKVDNDCGGNVQGWQPVDAPPAFTWVYTGDDGSTFTDNDPTTEVDLQFDASDNINTQYPQLNQLVKNLKDFVKNSPEVMASLQHWSGFTKQQILDKLTFGQGPVVKVVDLPPGVFSQYTKNTGENVLKIGRALAQGLEAAVLQETKRGTAFLAAVALLHEFVHYGSGQHNVSEGAYDFGWGFERTAFNVIVNQNNANEVSIRFRKLP